MIKSHANITIRQHTVPQVYLKQFTNSEGGIWIYSIERKSYVLQTPINTTVENKYYSFISEEGTIDNSIEDILGLVEQHYPAIIEKLSKKKPLTHKEDEQLALFVSFQALRTPKFKNWVSDFINGFSKAFIKSIMSNEKYCDSFLADFKRKYPQYSKIYREGLFDITEKYDLITPKEMYLETMIDFPITIAKLLLNMDWYFIPASPDSHYITNDSPFYAIPTGAGILTPNSLKVIPLSKSILLLIGDKGTSRYLLKPASKKNVKLSNKTTLEEGCNYIISTEKSTIEDLL